MSEIPNHRSLYEIMSRDGLKASSHSARHTQRVKRHSLNGRKPYPIHFASSRIRMPGTDFTNVHEFSRLRAALAFSLGALRSLLFCGLGLRKQLSYSHCPWRNKISRTLRLVKKTFSFCSTRERKPVADRGEEYRSKSRFFVADSWE